MPITSPRIVILRRRWRGILGLKRLYQRRHIHGFIYNQFTMVYGFPEIIQVRKTIPIFSLCIREHNNRHQSISASNCRNRSTIDTLAQQERTHPLAPSTCSNATLDIIAPSLRPQPHRVLPHLNLASAESCLSSDSSQWSFILSGSACFPRKVIEKTKTSHPLTVPKFIYKYNANSSEILPGLKINGKFGAKIRFLKLSNFFYILQS